MGQNREYRNTLFNYIDGIAVLTTIDCLIRSGIIEYIRNNKKVSFTEVADKFNAYPGYLNVAFRLCLAQGWLNRRNLKDGENYSLNISPDGEFIFNQESLISEFSNLLKSLQSPEDIIQNKNRIDNNIVDKLILLNNTRIKNILLGSIIGPIFVASGMNKIIIFNDDYLDFSKCNVHDSWESFIKIIFQTASIIDSDLKLTEFGRFLFKRASAFGVTVSYLPLLNNVDELIFKNPNLAHGRDNSGNELHVNRTMNVWGSGGAHSIYFKKIDEIIINIFNQPIDSQPKGIADMGCGNGEFLRHLYNVVKNQTTRGKYLESHPLLIIGADFNEAALVSSKITLEKDNIDHILVKGNIGNPKEFADNLLKKNINLKDCLNVRSFLDHNRQLDFPLKSYKNNSEIDVKGSFAFKGKWISGNKTFSDFVNHIQKWKPYIEKFGIILLELHTIDSKIASESIGQNVATAYDATHGYSDQYIIDYHSFKSGINISGLSINENSSIQFPNPQNPSISISLIQ